jgi:hypothetical protein
MPTNDVDVAKYTITFGIVIFKIVTIIPPMFVPKIIALVYSIGNFEARQNTPVLYNPDATKLRTINIRVTTKKVTLDISIHVKMRIPNIVKHDNPIAYGIRDSGLPLHGQQMFIKLTIRFVT